MVVDFAAAPRRVGKVGKPVQHRPRHRQELAERDAGASGIGKVVRSQATRRPGAGEKGRRSFWAGEGAARAVRLKCSDHSPRMSAASVSLPEGDPLSWLKNPREWGLGTCSRIRRKRDADAAEGGWSRQGREMARLGSPGGGGGALQRSGVSCTPLPPTKMWPFFGHVPGRVRFWLRGRSEGADSFLGWIFSCGVPPLNHLLRAFLRPAPFPPSCLLLSPTLYFHGDFPAH